MYSAVAVGTCTTRSPAFHTKSASTHTVTVHAHRMLRMQQKYRWPQKGGFRAPRKPRGARAWTSPAHITKNASKKHTKFFLTGEVDEVQECKKERMQCLMCPAV